MTGEESKYVQYRLWNTGDDNQSIEDKSHYRQQYIDEYGVGMSKKAELGVWCQLIL